MSTKPECHRKEDLAIITQLIDHLRGTCQSLDEAKLACGIERELEQWECEYIDEHIFRCECCSWWDDAGEQDKNQNCSDCAGEPDEE